MPPPGASKSACQSRSGGQPGDHVGLVGNRVEHVTDEECAGSVTVAAEPAAEGMLSGQSVGDDDRRVAARADEGAVGDDLYSLSRDTPFLGDVRGPSSPLAWKGLVLERIEV
jgi:hypothetical protein